MMFSGIVEDVGRVVSSAGAGAGRLLTVSAALPLEEMRAGDSISVAGACLSVTSAGGGWFQAEVSHETLRRTTLGRLGPGSKVNLERALELPARLGGHFVLGHVDGTGTVAEIRREGDSRVFHIRVDPSIMKLVVFKGSVAVDGVSLTVSALRSDGFEVTLIPLTLSRTTFGLLAPGDEVNVETDILGKYVLRFLEGRKGGLSVDFLRKHGFA